MIESVNTMTLLLFTLLLLSLRNIVASSVEITTEQELQQWPIMSRSAFTPTECDLITELYTSNLQRIEDIREEASVSRINRFDVRKKLLSSGTLDWIMDRVAEHLPLDCDSGDALKHWVDFTLLHEFNPGMFFGLHVDTRPNDNTYRTYNVNVMLSDPSEYTGGALQVGDTVLSGLRKGDLYMYPASLPHAVHDLESGMRHTFVIALRVPERERTDDARAAYWDVSEDRLDALALPPGRMAGFENKLHLIRAEFLESAGSRSDAEIDTAYCHAYKVTAEAMIYAQHFFEDGVKAVRESGSLATGASYFAMAVCIDPSHVQAREALERMEVQAKEQTKQRGKPFGVMGDL